MLTVHTTSGPCLLVLGHTAFRCEPVITRGVTWVATLELDPLGEQGNHEGFMIQMCLVRRLRIHVPSELAFERTPVTGGKQ